MFFDSVVVFDSVCVCEFYGCKLLYVYVLFDWYLIGYMSSVC